MKKIFLTSGVIVCMACPAAFGAASWSGALDGTEATGCTEPNLGVYSGPAQMDAIWTPNAGAITFQNHTIQYQQTACGVNNQLVAHNRQNDGETYTSLFTEPSPNGLFTLYSIGVYPSSAARAADTNYDGTGAITQLNNVPAYPGYTFDGYYTDQNYTTQKIDENGNISSDVKNMITENNGVLSLYAKWTPVTYTGAITYACGTYGSNTMQPLSNVSLTQDVTFDDCYSLATVAEKCEIPEHFGYTFAGWLCQTGTGNQATQANLPGATADSTTGYYAEGDGGVWNDAALATAGVTCTAQWAANEIIPITWNVGAGTAGATPGSTSCFYDGSVTLPDQPTRTGFTFGGWTIGTPAQVANP